MGGIDIIKGPRGPFSFAVAEEGAAGRADLARGLGAGDLAVRRLA
jgi:hypothetical protein